MDVYFFWQAIQDWQWYGVVGCLEYRYLVINMGSWEIPELAMEAAGKLLQLEDFPASHEADCWVCRFRQAQARWNFEIQRGPSCWVQRLKISWLRRTIDFCRCPWLLLIEIHDFPDSNGLVWGKEHYRQQYFLQMLGCPVLLMFPSTIFNQFRELTEPTFLFHGIILRVPEQPLSPICFLFLDDCLFSR